jgi:hypothetical protein
MIFDISAQRYMKIYWEKKHVIIKHNIMYIFFVLYKPWNNCIFQSLSLLKFLTLEKVKELRTAIAMLDNFPDKPEFKECRAVHHKLKYASGAFSLKKVKQ